MKEVSAGIIIYRKSDKDYKFLLLYHGGGYWNFPKGHIESQEKSWETAVREIREETGLKLTDLKFRRQFKTFDKFMFYREKEQIFKLVILYLAETEREDIKLSDEHDGYAWLTYKEAMKILKYKDSQRIITQAYNFLKRGLNSNNFPTPIPEMQSKPYPKPYLKPYNSRPPMSRPLRPSPFPKDRAI
ncbi:MAG: NUDIX domain-containing protein [Candidatus Wolfebacteria bacterium]|nr:NUDIX domain-containing protein [Candidatus Wolfebacteria bacterium]